VMSSCAVLKFVHTCALKPGSVWLQGWYIDPGEIAICKQDDGTDWLLGTGSYGKARP